MADNVKNNYFKIKEDLPSSVTLVAASKMQNIEKIEELFSVAPDIVFGENKVQELCDKYDARFKWHLIGQLQTNKVKYMLFEQITQ